MGKRKQWCLVLLALMVIASCVNQVYKSPSEMTPKERAVLAMKMYTNAYDDYIRQFEDTKVPFSEEAISYFAAYKNVLRGAWPVISAYDTIASVNAQPTEEETQQIIDLIYKLESMVKGAIK